MLQMVLIWCICECLTILIDCVQGLVPSFDVVAPGADHRICVRHLYVNYKDEGHRGVALKDKLWTTVEAYTEADFHKEIEELKGISQDAYDYLAKIDPSTWSRAWFNTFSQVWSNCEQPLLVFQCLHFEGAWLANNIDAGNVKKEADEEISNKEGCHQNHEW